MQANALTKQMRIGDEFNCWDDRYKIVDVHYAEVDPKNGRGLINFNAKRVAGAFVEQDGV